MSVNPFPNPYPASTPQLAYANNFSSPKPGSIADGAEVQDFLSCVMPADYAIFGTLVVNDSAVAQGIKYSTTDLSAGVVGFPVRTAALETRRDAYPPSYQPGDMVNVMRAGRIWTASEVAVSKHDKVFVRVTANGALNTIGALRNDADTAAAVEVPNARFMDDAAAGAPVRIEFNFIGQ